MYRGRHVALVVRSTAPVGASVTFGSGSILGASLRASGETNLQLTTPLLWTMIAISVAGAIVTFSFLVYALWRYRDPGTRRRRYG